MGCTASKLGNEDTVRQCKERRRLMKEAVYSRHHMAAAHADYCRSLRMTGSALCSFASWEQHLSVSEQTPAVFLQQEEPVSPRAPTVSAPTPLFSPTVAASNSRTTLPARRRPRIPRQRPKLPHILSESSLNSNTSSKYYHNQWANSTYSSTPSQASSSSSSSVWNWENFYPPSPPDSDFFDRKAREAAAAAPAPAPAPASHQHHLGVDDPESSEERERWDYDFFRPQAEAEEVYSKMGVETTEREEVLCSDWGDHDNRYSPTSSSSSDAEETIRRRSRRRSASRSQIGTSTSASADAAAAAANTTSRVEAGKPNSSGNVGENLEKSRSNNSSSFFGSGGEMRMVVRHKNLKEIVDAIKDNFDKAASAGDQISNILEIGRAQLDSSFRHLKKTVYHSSSMLSNLSSTWTSKPPLAVKYRLEMELDNQPGGGDAGLCSTLDRLLAWEKKLYQEVKAREGIKIEHEKKLSTLQSQEYKGEDETKLDKTKASIKRLQSLIIVTSQAVSTTSTAIITLRDSYLVPQLVELCHGLMYMWRSMYQYHEVQNNVVQQVRGLVNQSAKGNSTSELHRQATRDLESAVSAWHSSFCRLVKFQRDFLRSVHAWFKLTLLPVSNDNMNGIAEPSDVYNFFDEWKLALDRVPDTVASEAIKSFINVVHAISVKQTEEFKIKKRTETVSKELEKKASSLRNIERKFYHSYSMVGIGLPDTGPDNGQALDARDPLAEKKSELASCQRRVEDEMMRHVKAVEVTRAMTLNHLQTGLPGVFQAMTSFSSLFTEALEMVCTRSYAIKK